MKYALDTNIITYYLKGHKKIMDMVDSEADNDNIKIPPFVYFEIKKWLLIAAYCVQNNYILITNNQKHFMNIENLQIANWV